MTILDITFEQMTILDINFVNITSIAVLINSYKNQLT